MTDVRIEVKGIKDLYLDLSKYAEDLQTKVLRKAVRAGSKLIAKDARRRAPVRSSEWENIKYPTPPGTLKRGIRVSRARKQPKYIVRDVIGFSEQAWYGRLVETGHFIVRGGRLRKKGSKARIVGYSPPRPFLRPAFDANVNQAIEAMKTKMFDETKKLNFQILKAK